MRKTDGLYIGHITKTHAVQGAVQIELEQGFNEVKKWESILVDLDNALVPFFIEEINGKAPRYFVKFEDITDPEQAQKIVGRDVYGLPEWLPDYEESFSILDLIDFTVFNQNSELIGKIEDVMETSPGQYVAEVAYLNQKVMIPIHDDLIIELNELDKTISLNLADGLLDIYQG